MGDFTDLNRESAAQVAHRLVDRELNCSGYLVLTGEEMVSRFPQWLFAYAVPDRVLLRPNSVLGWFNFSELKLSAGW